MGKDNGWPIYTASDDGKQRQRPQRQNSNWETKRCTYWLSGRYKFLGALSCRINLAPVVWVCMLNLM